VRGLKFSIDKQQIDICDVMFTDNCDSLCTTYLKPMADPEISAQIQDWSTGGGLFLDYCNLLHSFAAYNKVSAADWFAGFFAVSSVMQMAV